MERSRRTFDTTTAKPGATLAIGYAMARRTFLAGAAGLVAAPILAAAKDKFDFRALRPYWNEIPDSAIVNVFPKQEEIRQLWGTLGPGGIIDAWGGAAWCASRRELIIAASGGHTDYFGNEVYAFSRDTLRWDRVRDSSAIKEPIIAGTSSFLMREGPVSRHTYSALIWAENAGRLMIGGAGASPSGQSIDNNWLYDPRSKTYEQLDERVLETIGGYDPDRGLVICVGQQLRLYDVKTRKVVHAMPLGINAAVQFGCGDYDPDSQTFVYFTNPDFVTLVGLAAVPRVVERGYVQSAESAASLASSGWSNAYPLIGNPPALADRVTARHGVAYHPPSKSFLCWDGGRDVIRFDHRTLRFTRLATPVGQLVPPPPTRNGVFGRWRYMADVDAFIGFASPNSNMWVYKAPV